MERQNRTALEIARRLESHPKVGAPWRCWAWISTLQGCCSWMQGPHPLPWQCLPISRLLLEAIAASPTNLLDQVLRVHYPGLESHPDHAIAVQQMTGYGGVVSW